MPEVSELVTIGEGYYVASSVDLGGSSSLALVHSSDLQYAQRSVSAAHKGRITKLICHDDKITTLSRDGDIKTWTTELKPLSVAPITENAGGVEHEIWDGTLFKYQGVTGIITTLDKGICISYGGQLWRFNYHTEIVTAVGLMSSSGAFQIPLVSIDELGLLQVIDAAEVLAMSPGSHQASDSVLEKLLLCSIQLPGAISDLITIKAHNVIALQTCAGEVDLWGLELARSFVTPVDEIARLDPEEAPIKCMLSLSREDFAQHSVWGGSSDCLCPISMDILMPSERLIVLWRRHRDVGVFEVNLRGIVSARMISRADESLVHPQEDITSGTVTQVGVELEVLLGWDSGRLSRHALTLL